MFHWDVFLSKTRRKMSRCTPARLTRSLTLALLVGLFVVWLDTRNEQHILKYAQKFQPFVWIFSVKTMRDNLTFSPNLTVNLVLTPTTNITVAEDLFHRYASEKQVLCPAAKRFGKGDDGGWDICLHGAYNISEPCLIYSFGINNDWSFDDAISSQRNCTVRAFDPSMQASDHRRGDRIWFYKLGIDGQDWVNKAGWKLKTLETILRMMNDSNAIIDYLKMDVEYSEWRALAHVIQNTTILSRVKQFGLEIHTKDIPMFRNSNPNITSTIEDLMFYTDVLRGLQNAGFYRWYWHYNHFGKFVSKYSQRTLTCCYEMVFINVNIPQL